MKMSISRVLLLLTFTLSFTHISTAQKVKTLSKVLELQMPDGEGTNGASVTWNKHKQLYYASFAGNVEYPLAVFGPTGSRVSADDLKAGFDVRGLWYNSKAKRLFFNGFSDSGWAAADLDNSGIPQTPSIVFEGKNQPDDQSVGVFDEKSNRVYFLSGPSVVSYDAGKGTKDDKSVKFHLGKTKIEEEGNDEEENYLPENYNGTSLIFTGEDDKEFGLLNIETLSIELYSRKTGLLTGKWELPEDVPVNDFFNLAYANGVVWIFNTETRTWLGYK